MLDSVDTQSMHLALRPGIQDQMYQVHYVTAFGSPLYMLACMFGLERKT